MNQVTEVPSPCISVCQLDPTSRFCIGCLRTVDEIAGWSKFSCDQKLFVWDALEDRQREQVSYSPAA